MKGLELNKTFRLLREKDLGLYQFMRATLNSEKVAV
jgi:hypothetical protein